MKTMKKRFLVLLTVIAVLATLLSGCGLETRASITIREDGSGTMAMRLGFDEEALRYLLSVLAKHEGQDLSEAQMNKLIAQVKSDPDTQRYTYGDKTYYGTEETEEFADLDELNERFGEMKSTDNAEEIMLWLGVDASSWTRKLNCQMSDTGEITLTVEVSADGEDTSLAEAITEALTKQSVSEEEAAQLIESFLYVFEFDLPASVSQISGESAGVTISDNHLTLDYLRIHGKMVFKTGTAAGTPAPAAMDFADVKESDWFYRAVKAAYDCKLMQGVGDGKFNPDGTLTYDQFAKILSNQLNWTDSGDSSYWAYGAVQNAVELGFIPNLGEITPANYGVAISREEAVAAMVKLIDKENTAPKHTFTAADIPDYDDVSPDLREAIVEAYCYGITTGVDDSHTFAPKGELKRAQICQLFLNIGFIE